MSILLKMFCDLTLQENKFLILLYILRTLKIFKFFESEFGITTLVVNLRLTLNASEMKVYA